MQKRGQVIGSHRTGERREVGHRQQSPFPGCLGQSGVIANDAVWAPAGVGALVVPVVPVILFCG